MGLFFTYKDIFCYFAPSEKGTTVIDETLIHLNSFWGCMVESVMELLLSQLKVCAQSNWRKFWLRSVCISEMTQIHMHTNTCQANLPMCKKITFHMYVEQIVKFLLHTWTVSWMHLNLCTSCTVRTSRWLFIRSLNHLKSFSAIIFTECVRVKLWSESYRRQCQGNNLQQAFTV